MAGKPKVSTQQVLQLLQGLQVLSNINWKGLAMVKNKLSEWFDGIRWSLVIPALAVFILIGLAIWDWRKAHTDLVEARAEIVAVTAERDTLATKVRSDEAARAERAAILLELAIRNEKQIEDLSIAVEENPGWANQPLPDSVRNALRR